MEDEEKEQENDGDKKLEYVPAPARANGTLESYMNASVTDSCSQTLENMCHTVSVTGIKLFFFFNLLLFKSNNYK